MRETKNEDLILILEYIPQTLSDKAFWDAGSFAHSFNGYEYAGSFDGCFEISQKVVSAIEENKTEDLTLSELRTCLFFHYRAVHHAGGPPNELRVNSLLELIRDRVSKNEME